MPKKPKIALVHDHLTQHGGAENVLLTLQDIWPDAPTYTLIYDSRQVHQKFKGKDIRTSFLQRMPGAKKHYQWYLPLMPVATESYDLRGFDIVISSASALAKGVITQPETLHICYCHTPTRYLWTDTHSYVSELRYPAIIKKILPRYLSRLRVWDRLAADRVDVFVANSRLVSKRIKKYYERDSKVIYPPVDIENMQPAVPSERITLGKPLAEDGAREEFKGFFLIGGRLVYYKRFDIAVRAFNKLGMKLKVFGVGPELEGLKKIAKPNVEFLGRVTEKEKIRLYQTAAAFLHPHEEDFGITAVEAMSCGAPVVAYKAGGALETIQEGKTGLFFEHQDWETLADTILRGDFSNFNEQDIHEHAQKFATEVFKTNIRSYVEQQWEQFSKS